MDMILLLDDYYYSTKIHTCICIQDPGAGLFNSDA